MTITTAASCGQFTTADVFVGDVRRFIAEALPCGLVYGVTSSGHSVVVRADEASGMVTVRVNDHEGGHVETVATPQAAPGAMRVLWGRVEDLSIRSAPADAPERGFGPRRIRPVVASVLECAADHLIRVGLHQGEREWARAPWTGPATVTHALTAAVRPLRGSREQRAAVAGAALLVLADHVHGRPVVVPHWWNSSAHAYLRATVWNWGDAPGRTTAGAVAFLRGAAALPAGQG